MKKLYKNQLAEVSKLQKNEFDSIEQMFEGYHADRLVPAFGALDANLDVLRRRCNTMMYWMQRMVMRDFPDDYNNHLLPRITRTGREHGVQVETEHLDPSR